jgi:hypothetical protein
MNFLVGKRAKRNDLLFRKTSRALDAVASDDAGRPV